MEPLFANRVEAGRQLAMALQDYAHQPMTLVLGIPRGGVVTAFEVAQILRLPLDIFVVRKLGVPGQEEYAMGAIAMGGFYVLDYHVIHSLRIPEESIQQVLRKERHELYRREHVYREGREPLSIYDKTLLLVDDGLATGSSVRAAVRALRAQRPAQIILAVPVAPPQTCQEFRNEVDQVVCLRTPVPFFSVGSWYENFPTVSDQEVCKLLEQAHARNLTGTSNACHRREAI